jgi:hypothetical protein
MTKFKFGRGTIVCWKTREGNVIAIMNMTSRHIKNTLRCLLGNGNVEIPENYMGKLKNEWFNILCQELRRRNEPLVFTDLY